MILGIDTSAAQCAVALLGAGDPVVERRAMERGHAEHLYPLPADAVWPGETGEAVCRLKSIRARCKLGRCSLVLRIV